MFSVAWLAVLSLAVFSGQGTLAGEPVFRLGKPTYYGSGCPTEKSIQVSTSTDGQILSVQLSQFAAATSSTVTRNRKACNLLLPVNVMQGMSIAVFKVDCRGHAFVPPASLLPGPPTSAPSPASASTASSFANFQTEYFFAGIRGPLVDHSWYAGTNASIDLSDSFQLGAQAWSPCGATSTFRINTAVTASKAKRSDEDAVIAVNATGLQVSGGIRFYITSQVCKDSGKSKDDDDKDKGDKSKNKF